MTVNFPTIDDLEEARLAVEAIASFDAHASDGQEPTSSSDLLSYVGATYLSNVVARCYRYGE